MAEGIVCTLLGSLFEAGLKRLFAIALFTPVQLRKRQRTKRMPSAVCAASC